MFTQVDPDPAKVVLPSGHEGYRGTFSKWQLIQHVGDGRSALVFVTDVTGPTYAYELPEGALE